jgi:hypothetical protein
MSERVRLVEERRYDPPRTVEVEHNGAWWPGLKRAWRLLDDGCGWLAEVEYVVAYDWGDGKHLGSVPADRVRLA